MQDPCFELRPARAEDADRLFAIHRAAMRGHVAATFGAWDEGDQRSRFDEAFDPARREVIVVGGRAVGFQGVEDAGEHLFLATLELEPDFQSRGIGSALVRRLLARGRPIELQVFAVNPARRLYERLGFREVGRSATHVRMRAEPAR